MITCCRAKTERSALDLFDYKYPMISRFKQECKLAMRDVAICTLAGGAWGLAYSASINRMRPRLFGPTEFWANTAFCTATGVALGSIAGVAKVMIRVGGALRE